MLILRKAAPIAVALSLAVAGGVLAGDNENAAFTLVGEMSVSGVGADERVRLEVAAEGLVGVKQLEVVLQVSDAAHFNLNSARLALGGGFEDVQTLLTPGLVEEGTDNQVRMAAAVTPPDQVDGEASITLSVKTSDGFTAETEASLSVAEISIGPSREDRDVFSGGDLGLSVTINPPPPPVTEPSLTASTAIDVSADYSPLEMGAAADGSLGEVTLGVVFADATGAAAAGQAVTFTVSNSGSETVHVLGEGSLAAGESLEVSVDTDASGSASITLDAEGDDSAGSTSAMVSAATSAPNTGGESRDLSVDFSVTWDVPVPAELASFAGEIAGEDEILLRWGVASQTNNLGWEVYRSVDGATFERVGDLVPGAGTSDEFRTYEFVDVDPPAADVVFYYLRQIDLNGAVSRSGTIEVVFATAVGEQVVPLASGLDQNYPNPFNPGTTIRFDLAEGSFVTLRIYDGLGQRVRTLTEASLPAGSYRETWDGRDSRGVRVGSGVYYYELRAGAFTSMKKMTLLQ